MYKFYIYSNITNTFTVEEHSNEYFYDCWLVNYTVGNPIVDYPHTADFIHKYIWEVVIQLGTNKPKLAKRLALQAIGYTNEMASSCVFCQCNDCCADCPVNDACGVCSASSSDYRKVLRGDMDAARRIQRVYAPSEYDDEIFMEE